MFCTHCGAQVNDTDKFCPECGKPLGNLQQNTEPERAETPILQPAPAPEPKKKSHKALWIVLTCIALAAVAACVLLLVLRPWQRCGKTAPDTEPSAPDVKAGEPAPEEAVRASFEALNKVDSMHLDFTETVSMSVGIPSAGYSQSMDIAIVLGIDTNKDPNVSKTEGYMEMLGTRQTVLIYSEEADGVTRTYQSTDEGKTWKQEDANPDNDSVLQNPKEAIDLWMKHAKDFRRVGTETLNGYETTVIAGTLSGEYVKEATGMTGGAFGALDEEVLKDLDDLPITFWIDNDSGCVVRMCIDMQDMMKTLLEKAMLNNVGELPDGMELSVEVDVATVDCVMTQFNAVPTIVIPEEARGAAAEPAAAATDSIVGTWTLCDGEGEESQQTVQMMLGLGMAMDFTFNEDGTGSLSTTYGEETDSQDFTYTLENGNIVINGDGAPYRIEDDLLYLMLDEIGLVFKRK